MASTVKFDVFSSKFEVSTGKGLVFMTPAEAERTFQSVPDVLDIFHRAQHNPAQAHIVPSTTNARGIRPRNYGRYGVQQ